ncbi:Acp53C14b [Drosophila busckii]|uniref:Acp53C14b n=1 Tax=Drosophila busckii TaxID=30019 RepID=A0A0M5IZ79_DROBS|nr:uncharacterized protein LOC108595963 [Drosophila busckii]ALC40998.1 Acp53C14b [Drosophila busckii]
MKFVKLSLFACSLLFLGSFRQAGAIDVELLTSCTQVVAEGASAFIPQIVPMIKDLATCTQYKPQQAKGLNLTMLLMMAFEFLQHASGKQQCLLAALDKSKALIMPHAAIFMMKGCSPLL